MKGEKNETHYFFTVYRNDFFILFISFGAKKVKGKEEIVDTKFVVVTGLLATATIFDIETAFMVIENPKFKKFNIYEGIPITRPFINKGRPVTYAFLGGKNAGIVYLSYRMKKAPIPP